jgi:hypothetical protein
VRSWSAALVLLYGAATLDLIRVLASRRSCVVPLDPGESRHRWSILLLLSQLPTLTYVLAFMVLEPTLSDVDLTAYLASFSWIDGTVGTSFQPVIALHHELLQHGYPRRAAAVRHALSASITLSFLGVLVLTMFAGRSARASARWLERKPLISRRNPRPHDRARTAFLGASAMWLVGFAGFAQLTKVHWQHASGSAAFHLSNAPLFKPVMFGLVCGSGFLALAWQWLVRWNELQQGIPFVSRGTRASSG